MKTNKNRLIPILLWMLLLLCAGSGYSQESKFSPVCDLKTTSVKNQAMSSTCWSFAVMSMLESELLRMGKDAPDLSEMYYVYYAYPLKAYYYYLLQGKGNFGPGGQGHDVIELIRNYGIVPESAYSGLLNGQTHNQLVMDSVIMAVMQVSIQHGKNDYQDVIRKILDEYLGSPPPSFQYNGKEYNPVSFAAHLGINPDDYIELSSYTHHPWYSAFRLEVPDNWMSGTYYNLPVDELLEVMKYSLEQGYTLCWDGDVSDEEPLTDESGYTRLADEKTPVTQKMRQDAFSALNVTDDHLMHITGIIRNAKGHIFFKTKNSWGVGSGQDGYWFLSEPYVRLKTIAILVNKSAIPEHIRQKLGIKP